MMQIATRKAHITECLQKFKSVVRCPNCLLLFEFREFFLQIFFLPIYSQIGIFLGNFLISKTSSPSQRLKRLS
jgi:hypothetical protein